MKLVSGFRRMLLFPPRNRSFKNVLFFLFHHIFGSLEHGGGERRMDGACHELVPTSVKRLRWKRGMIESFVVANQKSGEYRVLKTGVVVLYLTNEVLRNRGSVRGFSFIY